MKEIIFLLFVSSAWLSCDAAAARCCGAGEYVTKKGICSDGSRTNITCPYGRWLLKDVVLVGDKVYTQDAPNFLFVEDTTQYCLVDAPRNFSNVSDRVPSAIVCTDGGGNNSYGIEVTGYLTLTSVVFLVFTLAIYLYLPQLRDLQGLCYISLCISMALGYLSLGILQLNPEFNNEICTLTGFMVYFWMMATFFWMNVISINTYRSIISPMLLLQTERQQYLRYSCYAWGSTSFFLIVSLCTNFAEGEHWKPGFGAKSCWFQGPTETWIFFYGPVAVLIACNVALFVSASIILWKQNRKYEVDKLNNLKHKFLLSLKLFLVMGISWVFEIVSFAHGTSTVLWTIMDTFNCLQGLVIFILLVVLRRRAMQGLASENCCLMITRPLAEKLSPHDDEDTQRVLNDDTMEVRLN